jgi:hypothetical protein
LHIKIRTVGPPSLADLIGKEGVLECPKTSIKGLIDTMIGHFGSAAGDAILDKTGNLDRAIQVVINDRDYVKPQDFEKVLLKDGDTVTFIMLAYGG